MDHEEESHSMASIILANSCQSKEFSRKRPKVIKLALCGLVAILLALAAFVIYLSVKITHLEGENEAMKTNMDQWKFEVKEWKSEEKSWKNDFSQSIEERHAHLHHSVDSSTLSKLEISFFS